MSLPALDGLEPPVFEIPEAVCEFRGEVPVDADVTREARELLLDMRSRSFDDDRDQDDIMGQYTASALRIAVSLSIIMGETDLRVTRRYWDLAKQVLEVSAWTRDRVLQRERRTQREAATRRTLESIEAREAAEARRDGTKAARLAATIRKAIREPGDGGPRDLVRGSIYTHAQVLQKLASRDRKTDPALQAVDALVRDGVLVEAVDAGHYKYRIA